MTDSLQASSIDLLGRTDSSSHAVFISFTKKVRIVLLLALLRVHVLKRRLIRPNVYRYFVWSFSRPETAMVPLLPYLAVRRSDPLAKTKLFSELCVLHAM